LSKFPDNGWKLRSIDSLLKRVCNTGKIARISDSSSACGA